MAFDSKTTLSRARVAIKIEQEALTATARGLDEKFVAVARAVHATNTAGRKLIFTGIGLQRSPVIIVGVVMVSALALLVSYLADTAGYLLSPKGL